MCPVAAALALGWFMQKTPVATAHRLLWTALRIIQDALFIQSNTMNFVMNKARKYKVFETQASAALFGLGCVSLCGCSPPQIWSSGPRAKWLLDKTSGQGGQRAQEGQEGQRDCWVIVALELVSCLGHGWFSCETSNLRSLQYLSFKRRCTDRHFGEDIRQRERGRGNRVGDRWRDRDWVVVALELVSLVGHWPAPLAASGKTGVKRPSVLLLLHFVPVKCQPQSLTWDLANR